MVKMNSQAMPPPTPPRPSPVQRPWSVGERYCGIPKRVRSFCFVFVRSFVSAPTLICYSTRLSFLGVRWTRKHITTDHMLSYFLSGSDQGPTSTIDFTSCQYHRPYHSYQRQPMIRSTVCPSMTRPTLPIILIMT